MTAHKPVVFFHVMKCGGTSVRAGLAAAAARGGGREGVFELDGQAAIQAVGGDDATNWRFRDQLLSYLLLATDPGIVLGHFRYRDAHAALLDRASFVTVLRDPVDRLVSLYRYRRWKDDVDVPVTVGFDEFLDTSRWQKEGHLYVRTFCGRDDLDVRSEEAAQAAVANLRRFAAVGHLDRIEDFAADVSTVIGRPVNIPMLNATPAPDASANGDVSDAALARAREICEPDYRVYDALRTISLDR